MIILSRNVGCEGSSSSSGTPTLTQMLQSWKIATVSVQAAGYTIWFSVTRAAVGCIHSHCSTE